ncbi:MAG: DUF255 domain-containing protein [Siphonobacter sp.]
MRALLLLLFVLSGLPAVRGQVNFVQGNLRTPFNQAKAGNKLVFIEVYSPTCHICESFIPTFQNAEVGKAFNTNFVSYKLDVNTAEAQSFLAKQHLVIPSLPIFLFFDPNVKLLHAQNSPNSVKDIIAVAKNAVSAKLRASNYTSRFRSGDRNADFLADYAYYSRIVKDTAANIQAVNAYAKSVSNYTDPVSFALIQKAMLDAENPLFEYFVKHIADYRKGRDAKEIQTAGETVVMSTLYSSRGSRMSSERITRLGSYLATLGLDKKTVENRTLIPELNAYIRAGQWNKVPARVDRYIKSASPGIDEYRFIGKYLAAKAKDKTILLQAAGLLMQAAQRMPGNITEKANLQSEAAQTYKRIGNKAEAIRLAQMAVQTAKAGRFSAIPYEKILKEVSK